MRERLGVLLVALSRQDPDRMTAAVIALSATPGAVDRAGLRSDLAALVAGKRGPNGG